MEKNPLGEKALITNIQRFCVQDGPGFRTTVFVKGCLLKCPWCHNPETLNYYSELYYKKERCALCGTCTRVCPKADKVFEIKKINGGILEIKRYREHCAECDLRCVDACPNSALERVGYYMPVRQIIEEAASDKIFYKHSGGGMTISGGECLYSPELTLLLLKEAKKEGIHTAIDTSGYGEWEIFEKILEFTDWVLYDIKCLDSKKHEKVTGVPNELILDNLEKIAKRKIPTRIRIPTIPDFNDFEEEMEKIAQYLLKLGEAIDGVDILPYHTYMLKKYEQLEKDYPLKGVADLSKEDVVDFEEIFKKYGFHTTIGGMIGVRKK